MSGMVGIVNFDGAPIDRALLSRMTAALDFRGPDARRIWIAEPTPGSGSGSCAGFGHTLLRTTYEAEHEQQPFTLDGNTWIVADCRVDAREELLAKLRAKGRDASLRRPDVELILHAWHVWGEECVEHLLGDFAFAIWDAPRRRLFCTRDHMGVKPFYYAHIGSTLIFSNTLDCVRLHPAVSDTLNDLAIADFLLFDGNREHSTTSFAEVQRIAPGHTAEFRNTDLRLRRYWTLPIEEPIYYRRDQDYVDRFRELLRESVSDRLRTPSVSILMSGGLDSPGLAAIAVERLRSSPARDPVCAFTWIFGRLMPDSERYHASAVAKHLGIPIEFSIIDEQVEWAQPGSRRVPEPVSELPVDFKAQHRQYTAMASHSRVALYGEGPDNALDYEWQPYLGWLIDRGRWGRLVLDGTRHVLHHKRIPLLPTIPRMLRECRKFKGWDASFPGWLEVTLVERLRLRDRWRDLSTPAPSAHPVRPRSHASLQRPIWQDIFEQYEPPFTNAVLEIRNPYTDIRMLQYMLRVPALPWCRRKQLLRRAFRGILPDSVLNRSKTPLSKKPHFEQAMQSGFPLIIRGPQLGSYGSLDGLDITRPIGMGDFNLAFRFAALSHWLQCSQPLKYTNKEKRYDLSRNTVAAGCK